MRSVGELRQSLEQCRRLHDSILDQRTRTNLTTHADDLEMQIAAAEEEKATPADTGGAADMPPAESDETDFEIKS